MDADVNSKIKGLAFASIVSIIMLIISLYCYGIEAFHDLGLENYAANQVFWTINKRLQIFDSQLLYKLLILAFLTPSVLFGINKPLKKYNLRNTILLIGGGVIIFLIHAKGWWYIFLSLIGFFTYSIGLIRINIGEQVKDNEDLFNDIEEAFPQCEKLIQNKYSINLPMHYYLKKNGKLEKREGWLNITSIFRAIMITGSPGSGKTYSLIEPALEQLLNKGFCLCTYDFKYPSLSRKVYNYYLKAQEQKKFQKINPSINARFYVINFDNPALSNRCNPISPSLLRDDTDALNIAINTMCALNPQWRREADFFAQSAMNIFAAILLFLRNFENGRFCTFPHAVELLSSDLDKLIPILLSQRNLENITRPFEQAFKSGAMEQLMGQTASAQIPLSRLATENVYYVSTGNDFELDINDPLEPKIVCIANNPLKTEAYSTPLSVYFYQIILQVNQQNKWPSCLALDEFPTVYLANIDKTINTARSNRVCVLLAAQDISQLQRDYGEEQAKVIINTPANFLTGQVTGESAEMVSKFFGKKIQRRNSHSISESSVSLSVNEQLEEMFPPNKISTLSQGQIIGRVADSFEQPIPQKLYNCTIDVEKIKSPENDFVDLPIITHFPKESAPEELVQEYWNEYTQRFQNVDVDYIMTVIMSKADEKNIYEYNSNDFNLTIPELTETSKQIIKQKFDIHVLDKHDEKLKNQLLQHLIGRLTSIGFLANIGSATKWYVTIWMRAYIRETYYRVKQEVSDLVNRKEQELLSDPNCLKFFRIEYLQKLQKEYEQEAAEKNMSH